MKKIAIFAMSFSAIGYAQQPKAYNIEKDTLGLEEVVITANRIEEKKTDAVANVYTNSSRPFATDRNGRTSLGTI